MVCTNVSDSRENINHGGSGFDYLWECEAKDRAQVELAVLFRQSHALLNVILVNQIMLYL